MKPYLVILALLCACTTIDYREGPVPGLENMTVEEHRVDTTEIYQRCSSCGRLGLELPTACTCINLRTNRAVIWLTRDASEATIEHERAHGRGYDHQGGELRFQYAAWTKSGGKRIAPAITQAYGANADLTKVSALKPGASTE